MFSKQSFNIVNVLLKDTRDALNKILFTKEGATIATDGRVLIAVSPMQVESEQQAPLIEKDVSIFREDVKNIFAEIKSKDIHEHIHIEQDKTGLTADINANPGIHITTRIPEKPYPTNWQTAALDVFNDCEANDGIAALNLSTLIRLLTTMQKIASNKDQLKNRVYLQTTKNGDMVFSSYNFHTKQTIVALQKRLAMDELVSPGNNVASKILGLSEEKKERVLTKIRGNEKPD